MTFKEHAEKICGYIVAGFIREPQQPAAETAEAVRLIMPIDPVLFKNVLDANYPALLSIAHTILDQEIEATPEDQKTLDSYFKNVYNLLTVNKPETSTN